MIVTLVLWLASCLMSHIVNTHAAVDCGELTDPANGQVLTEKGNLIPVFYSHAVVDCGSLNSPPNGRVRFEPTMTTTFNSRAIYSCDPGYSRSGSSLRICEDNGEWSGNAPICLGMRQLH